MKHKSEENIHIEEWRDQAEKIQKKSKRHMKYGRKIKHMCNWTPRKKEKEKIWTINILIDNYLESFYKLTSNIKSHIQDESQTREALWKPYVGI